jgi:hypothetical protein
MGRIGAASPQHAPKPPRGSIPKACSGLNSLGAPGSALRLYIGCWPMQRSQAPVERLNDSNVRGYGPEQPRYVRRARFHGTRLGPTFGLLWASLN